MANITIPVIADTVIYSGSPNDNFVDYNMDGSISVSSNKGYIVLYFDISQIKHKKFTEAKLTLTNTGTGIYASQHYTYNVHYVNENSASSITYANRDTYLIGYVENGSFDIPKGEKAINVINMKNEVYARDYIAVTLYDSGVGNNIHAGKGTAKLEVAYEDVQPSIKYLEFAKPTFNSSEEIKFSWEYSCKEGSNQACLETGWSADFINWNRLYLDEWTEQSYIIPANTLPGGSIYLCTRVASVDNVWSEYIYTTFNVEENIPVVTPTYPLDVNVSNSSNVIFTWDYTEPLEVGQNLYVLSWSSNNGLTWNDIAHMSSEHYCEVPADTFPVGNILWKIKVTNNHGKTSAESMARFTAIGQTDAPTIISVSNSAIPEVTWTSEFQDAYEVRLRQNSEIIYESGLQTGADVRSHKCNVILENGIYTAEARVLNTYGYYSEWSTYGFILDLPSPDAPQNVFVSLNNRYGIDISGDINAGDTGYVVRRESSDDTPVVLAEYTGEFTDYKAALNKAYQYTLRSVGDMTSGYADGEWIDAAVSLNDTVLLHDINDMSSFVMLSYSDEQFDIVRNDSLTKTLRQCIGRVYPVKEQMDWIVTTREFTAWVSNEDYNKLLGMSTAYYRADGEAFLCDLEISDGGKYIGGGRIVKFVVTRLDEDLEVML